MHKTGLAALCNRWQVTGQLCPAEVILTAVHPSVYTEACLRQLTSRIPSTHAKMVLALMSPRGFIT